MQKQGTKYNAPTTNLGKVITSTPLNIKIGELFLDREDLIVNENIKGFNKGDTLAMVLAPNQQKYIILCKVVDL